jgi:hypothetical protein
MDDTLPAERVALVDLLDRLLAGGAMIAGDIVISVADVDLVRVSLRALVTAVREESHDVFPHRTPSDRPGNGRA